MKRFYACLIFILMIFSFFPENAFAVSEAPPAERVVSQIGRWQIDSDTVSTGQSKLWSMYIGDKEQSKDRPARPLTFSVRQTTRLSRIHVEYKRLQTDLFDKNNSLSENGSSNFVSKATSNIVIGNVVTEYADEKTAGNASAGSNTDAKPGDVLVPVDDSLAVEDGVTPLTATNLRLKDAKGKLLGDWEVKLEFASEQGAKMPETAPGVAIMEDDDIVLKPGTYTVELDSGKALYNAETGYEPAAAVIGINYDAWKKYQDILKGTSKTKTDSKDKGLLEFGEVMVSAFSETKYLPKSQDIPNEAKMKGTLKPAVFELAEERMIEEIQTEHFNESKGAVPGVIKLVGGTKGKEKIYGPWTAKSGKLSGAENGVWVVKPKVVLPPGKYTIVDSGQDTLSFNPDTLEPEFYVKAVDPPTFDFTGTYFVSIRTATTKCLNPDKIGKPTSFDRDSLEIAVLDKGDYMEIIGRYTQEKKKDILSASKVTEYDFKDVPFSQICKVSKRDAVSATAEFNFNIDLTGLPYKAMVGTSVPLSFDASQGYAALNAKGSAYYIRMYSEGYGGDNNEYSVKVSGQRAFSQLPDYVRIQMIKVGNLGNVPGPDNTAQGVIGTLFPPLTALVLQIAFTMKKPGRIIAPPDDGGGGESGSDPGDGGDGSGDDGGSDDSGEFGSDSGDGGSDSGSDGNAAAGYDFGNADGGGSSENGNSQDGTVSADQPGVPDKGAETSDSTGSGTGGGIPEKNGGLEQGGQNQPQPEDGQELTVHDYGDGKDKTYIYDAYTSKWTNLLTGAEYDPDAYATAQKTYMDDQDRADKYKQFLDNVAAEGSDKFLAEVVSKGKDKMKAMDQLQGIGNVIRDNNLTDDGLTSLTDRADKLTNDLLDGIKTIDEIKSDIQRLKDHINNKMMGRSGTQSDIDLANTRLSTASILAHGTVNTFSQIGSTAGGVFVDGATGKTWTGLTVRGGMAIATGGVSEAAYMGTNIAINAYGYTQKGEDVVTAVAKATGAEAAGTLLGLGVIKCGSAAVKGIAGGVLKTLGYEFKPNITLPPSFTDTANSFKNTAETVKKTLNTDIRDLFGSGSGSTVKGSASKSAGGLDKIIRQAQNEVKSNANLQTRNGFFYEGRVDGAKKVNDFNKAYDDYLKNPTSENEIRVKNAAADVQQDYNAKHVLNDLPQGEGDSVRKNFNRTIDNGNRNIDHRQTQRIDQEYQGIPDPENNLPSSRSVKVTNAAKADGTPVSADDIGGYANKTGNNTVPKEGPLTKEDMAPPVDNPGDVAGHKVGYDNDATHRVRQEVVDPRTGEVKTGYADVPEQELSRIRNQELYREYHNGSLPKNADGKIDMSRIDDFAKKMDYVSNDRLSAEAYGTGNRDLQIATSKNPEIKGQNFSDVESVSKTMELKSNKPYQEAMKAREEAVKLVEKGDFKSAGELFKVSEKELEESMRQTTKQFDNLLVERVNIAGQSSGGRSIRISPELHDAIDIMKKVGSGPGKISPVEAEKALQILGTNPNEVAIKVSANLESLQKFK